MNTKLAINLSEGTVQVEGTEDFVRFIYQDFKESLSKHVFLRTVETTPPVTSNVEPPLLTTDKTPQRRQPKKKRSSSGEEKLTRPVAYSKPKYNSELDLTGLEEFYDQWKPENNPEKILVFLAFLRDRLGKTSSHSDDVYTCFFAMRARTKIPGAFRQAFHDMKGRTHYIDFETTDSIEISIAGDNWFKSQTKKLKEAKT